MSVDPYRDMAQWLDMTPAEEARLWHPAGKGIRESDEVAQERMNAEACELGSSNSQHPKPSTRWQNIRNITGIIIAFALVANAAPILSGLAGWIS